MPELIAIKEEEVEQYLNKIVALTKDVYAVLLCTFTNGYYTSIGYTDKVYVPEEGEKIVLYNAAAGLDLPLDWPDRTVRHCSISIKDNGFHIECSEEKYRLVSVDFETCKSIWKNSQFKTIDLPSIYTLSDGRTTNIIGINY